MRLVQKPKTIREVMQPWNDAMSRELKPLTAGEYSSLSEADKATLKDLLRLNHHVQGLPSVSVARHTVRKVSEGP